MQHVTRNNVRVESDSSASSLPRSPGQLSDAVPQRHFSSHFTAPSAVSHLKRAGRAKEVMYMTGDKRSHFYDRMNPKSPAYDPTFPRPFRLSDSARAPTVWWVDEILAWLEARAAKSRKN